MDVDGAVDDEDVGAPDGVEQLLAGEHAAGVGGEVVEQLELLAREAERLLGGAGGRVAAAGGAGADDEVAAAIHDEVVHPEPSAVVACSSRSPWRSSARTRRGGAWRAGL